MRTTLIIFLWFFATTAFAQQKDSVNIKPLQMENKAMGYQKLKWINFQTGGDITWLFPTAYVGLQIKTLKNMAIEASLGILPVPAILITSKKIGLVKYFVPNNNAAFFAKVYLEQINIDGIKTPFFPKLSVGMNANHFNLSAGIGGYENGTNNKYYQHGTKKYLIFPSLTVGYSTMLFKPKNNFK